MPDPLFQLRKAERDSCRDFWAMIRWGAFFAVCIWGTVTMLERIGLV